MPYLNLLLPLLLNRKIVTHVSNWAIRLPKLPQFTSSYRTIDKLLPGVLA